MDRNAGAARGSGQFVCVGGSKLNPKGLIAYRRINRSGASGTGCGRSRRGRCTPLKTEELIKELNPTVRGWGEYYKRAHVRTLFHKLDGWIRAAHLDASIPVGLTFSQAISRFFRLYTLSIEWTLRYRVIPEPGLSPVWEHCLLGYGNRRLGKQVNFNEPFSLSAILSEAPHQCQESGQAVRHGL